MRSSARTVRGEVTVFLALIISLLSGLILVLTESARLQLIRMNTEALMDIGLSSCFGEYDVYLFNRYDLLFIDSSYRGSAEVGISSVINHLSRYISANTDYSGTDAEADWYRQSLDRVNEDEYELASDDKGRVLKYQASGYINGYGEFTYTPMIDGNHAAIDAIVPVDLISEWDAVLNSIDSFGIPVEDPGREVRSMVLSEEDFIKEQGLGRIGMSDLPSCRELKSGNGSPPGIRQGDDEAFIEYLMQKMGCYTRYTDEQQLKGELEYMICGRDSDIDNMTEIVRRLMSIREGDNLRCIRSDEGRMEGAYLMAAEAVEAAAMMFPELPLEMLTSLVRDSIIYALAYAESAMDVSRLLAGGRCPVNKSVPDLLVSLYDLTGFMSRLGMSGGKGADYKDILGVFLSETDDDIRRMRCMDIIEINCRTFNNDGFRIDGCVDHLKATALLMSGYGYSHEITRERYYE
ncbi:MAG: DUF5702 domain-containing protein [Lachnospiraceae bacterium]|nr:DUF5702 domain-containing protein [Lachnospiraceae bacterium]